MRKIIAIHNIVNLNLIIEVQNCMCKNTICIFLFFSQSLIRLKNHSNSHYLAKISKLRMFIFVILSESKLLVLHLSVLSIQKNDSAFITLYEQLKRKYSGVCCINQYPQTKPETCWIELQKDALSLRIRYTNETRTFSHKTSIHNH